MNIYCVKRIVIDGNGNYWNKVKNTTTVFCNGIKELREYCGGRLHRENNINGVVYSGINGNIHYKAYKIN